MANEAQQGVAVGEVFSGGIGEEVGLVAGDIIEAINGISILDPIDYRFHIAEEKVQVQVRKGKESQQIFLLEIEKDPDEDLGIVLDDMPIFRCDNKCVFCFLHQMPKGV